MKGTKNQKNSGAKTRHGKADKHNKEDKQNKKKSYKVIKVNEELGLH